MRWIKNKDNLLLVIGVSLGGVVLFINSLAPPVKQINVLEQGFEKNSPNPVDSFNEERTTLIGEINNTLSHLQEEISLLENTKQSLIAENDKRTLEAELFWLQEHHRQLNSKKEEAATAHDEVWKTVKQETDSILRGLNKRLNDFPKQNK